METSRRKTFVYKFLISTSQIAVLATEMPCPHASTERALPVLLRIAARFKKFELVVVVIIMVHEVNCYVFNLTETDRAGQHTETGRRVRTGPISVDTRNSFPWGKIVRSVQLTSRLHLVPRLRWLICTFRSRNVFRARWLMKQRNSCLIYIIIIIIITVTF